MVLSKHYKKIFFLFNVWVSQNKSSRTAVSLAYKHYGTKLSTGSPPIIVLHGLLGSKKNWNSLCTKIAKSTQQSVVACDLRNHGESPHDSSHTYPELASDVILTMNNLSVNKASFIGHSMGGRTAMTIALTEPEKVHKLICVDISPVSTAGLENDFFPRLMKVLKPIDFSGLDLAKARTLVRQKIRESGLIEHDAMMDFIIMNVGRGPNNTIKWMINVSALEKHFLDIATFPKELITKKYTGPTLFIGGGESDYLPPSDIEGIKTIFPKVDVQFIANAGHNVHAEAPDEFLDIVSRFLK